MYFAPKLPAPCPATGASAIIAAEHRHINSRPSAESFFHRYNATLTPTATTTPAPQTHRGNRLHPSHRPAISAIPTTSKAAIPVLDPDRTTVATTAAATHPPATRFHPSRVNNARITKGNPVAI